MDNGIVIMLVAGLVELVESKLATGDYIIAAGVVFKKAWARPSFLVVVVGNDDKQMNLCAE
jgi:hypothetical protein